MECGSAARIQNNAINECSVGIMVREQGTAPVIESNTISGSLEVCEQCHAVDLGAYDDQSLVTRVSRLHRWSMVMQL